MTFVGVASRRLSSRQGADIDRDPAPRLHGALRLTTDYRAVPDPDILVERIRDGLAELSQQAHRPRPLAPNHEPRTRSGRHAATRRHARPRFSGRQTAAAAH